MQPDPQILHSWSNLGAGSVLLSDIPGGSVCQVVQHVADPDDPPTLTISIVETGEELCRVNTAAPREGPELFHRTFGTAFFMVPALGATLQLTLSGDALSVIIYGATP